MRGMGAFSVSVTSMTQIFLQLQNLLTEVEVPQETHLFEIQRQACRHAHAHSRTHIHKGIHMQSGRHRVNRTHQVNTVCICGRSTNAAIIGVRDEDLAVALPLP